MRVGTQSSNLEPGETLRRYYDRLLERLGPQRWWPARTRLEIILGAILTQNTNWKNAALALKSLRKSGLLRLARLRRVLRDDLQTHIRSAGFFRQKARTIQSFLGWLKRSCRGSLKAMFERPAAELRRELLGIRGLGPETVDAVLLYAGGKPFFVADAYTQRILARHGLVRATAGYSQVQLFLHRHLPPDARLFNEYHALLVEVGKRYCRRGRPRCEECPLEEYLPPSGAKRLAAQAA